LFTLATDRALNLLWATSRLPPNLPPALHRNLQEVGGSVQTANSSCACKTVAFWNYADFIGMQK
jgi:hypothetical protein